MIVFLNRKTLEAPLIQMAGAGSVMMGMPSLRVGVGQPTDKCREWSSRGHKTKCQ